MLTENKVCLTLVIFLLVCMPEAPINGYLYPREKRAWHANELIIYRCNPGFKLREFATRFCRSDGVIEGSTPKCIGK